MHHASDLEVDQMFGLYNLDLQMTNYTHEINEVKIIMFPFEL